MGKIFFSYHHTGLQLQTLHLSDRCSNHRAIEDWWCGWNPEHASWGNTLDIQNMHLLSANLQAQWSDRNGYEWYGLLGHGYTQFKPHGKCWPSGGRCCSYIRVTWYTVHHRLSVCVGLSPHSTTDSQSNQQVLRLAGLFNQKSRHLVANPVGFGTRLCLFIYSSAWYLGCNIFGHYDCIFEYSHIVAL